MANKAGSAQRKAFKEKLFKEQKGRCFYCNEEMSFAGATLEHLIPREFHGRYNYVNLVLAHRSCNQAVIGLTVVEKVIVHLGKRGLLNADEDTFNEGTLDLEVTSTENLDQEVREGIS